MTRPLRITVDTNVVFFAADDRDSVKRLVAQDILARIRALSAPIALQVVGEFYAAVTRRLGTPPSVAARAANNLLATYPTFGSSPEVVALALEAASAGRFSYWDALLLASADRAGCDVLLSEDMADGARLGSTVVVQPFGRKGLSTRALRALAAAEGTGRP